MTIAHTVRHFLLHWVLGPASTMFAFIENRLVVISLDAPDAVLDKKLDHLIH